MSYWLGVPNHETDARAGGEGCGEELGVGVYHKSGRPLGMSSL